MVNYLLYQIIHVFFVIVLFLIAKNAFSISIQPFVINVFHLLSYKTINAFYVLHLSVTASNAITLFTVINANLAIPLLIPMVDPANLYLKFVMDFAEFVYQITFA